MALEFIITDEDRQDIGGDALTILADVYAAYIPHPTGQVDLSLVSLQEMQDINRTQRAIDQPTDVLSFPVYTSRAEMENAPREMPLLVGAIIISPEKATIYEETLPQLVHHGLLHLLGYDHETDLAGWQKIEEEILKLLHSRGLAIPGIPV